MDKATRAQVKQHNRRLVMRAIYQKTADNRAALAKATQLTKPTIGTIMNELIEAGYVVETGYGTTQRRGGKRPMLVQFVPTARQIIGVSVGQNEIVGGLGYLNGDIVARHQTTIPDNGDPLQLLRQTIHALLSQHDAPLLGIVIGVSGIVEQDLGVVIHSKELNWRKVHLADQIESAFDLPCYVSNNTELVTRLHATGTRTRHSQMVTVSVGNIVEIGSTFGGDVYQHGAPISNLPVPNRAMTIANLHWDTVQAAMQTIISQQPDGVLATYGTNYYALRHAVSMGDASAIQLVDNLSACLAYLYRWVFGLMRPAEIILVGNITHLSETFLSRVYDHLQAYANEIDISALRLSLDSTPHLSMKGAVVYGIQTETGIL